MGRGGKCKGLGEGAGSVLQDLVTNLRDRLDGYNSGTQPSGVQKWHVRYECVWMRMLV